MKRAVNNMKRRIYMFSRVALGIIFFGFGINGLFGLFPTPSVHLEAATFPADYFFPFVKVVEIACGFLLLVNRFVPLAIVAITPVIVNIVLFHVFVDPQSFPVAIVLLVLQTAVVIGYRRCFAGLLRAHATPS